MTTEIEPQFLVPRRGCRLLSIPRAGILLPIQILILVSLGPACAPRLPKPPAVTPGAEGARTIRRFLAEAPCPDSIASDLEFKIRPPDRPEVRLVGSLRALWPDRVRLQLRFGPFTPVASIAVRADSAFMSFPKIKAYWSGPPSATEGSSPAALVSGLLGLLCPGPWVRSIEHPVLDRTGKGWTLSGRMGGEGGHRWLASFRLSNDGGEIEEIAVADSQGTVLFRAERSGKVRVGGAVICEGVLITTGTPPISFAARLMRTRSDHGQSPDLFRIRPPPGVRRIEERELLDLLYSGGSHP